MISLNALLPDLRNPWRIFSPLLFMLGGSLLFVLALGPDLTILESSSTSVIWTLFLFAFFLSLSGTFQDDVINGTLDQLYLRSTSLVPYFLKKAIIHWAFSALPLLLFCPLLAVLFNTPDSQGIPLMGSLLLTTPTLSLLGVLCQSLTVGTKSNVFLSTLILLPFSIPLLVFATTLGQSSFEDAQGHMAALFLGAFLCVALALCPPLGALILKQVIHDA